MTTPKEVLAKEVQAWETICVAHKQAIRNHEAQAQTRKDDLKEAQAQLKLFMEALAALDRKP